MNIPLNETVKQLHTEFRQKIVLSIRPFVTLAQLVPDDFDVLKLTQHPVQALLLATHAALRLLYDKCPDFLYILRLLFQRQEYP